MPKLILKFGPAVIKDIPITKNILTVGRKEDNDIVIDNPAVSGHHAKIYQQGNSYVVEDLGSTNGTFINEKKVLKAALKNSDQIGLAKHTLTFVSDDKASDSPEAAPPKGGGETIVIDAKQQRELLSGAKPKTTGTTDQTAAIEKTGALRIVDGVVDKTEIELSGILTYIGTSETSLVKIKGMFAPSAAAAIARKPDGYVLKAIKEGYPKVNDKSLKGETKLKDGDMLEFGKTKMVFFEKVKK
ncbi:MAG: FHA domain-containing protein [Elusimicrobia bacterium]|nr:FHA domain-containing protein [Elusimicrobiota bacterium]